MARCPNCGFIESRDEAVRRIITDTEGRWGIDPGMLTSKTKGWSLYEPRRQAMREMHFQLGLSHDEIATVFSGRNRSIITRLINDTYVRRRPEPTQKAHQVVREVADSRGVKVSDIRGPRRTKELASARREAARRLTNDLHLTREVVGQLLNRDHSTVVTMLQHS